MKLSGFSPGYWNKAVPSSRRGDETATGETEAAAAWREDPADRETALFRWQAERFPLRVLLPSERSPRESPLFLEALRQWEAALPEVIRFYPPTGEAEFNEGSDQKKVDLIFVWSDQPTLGREYEVGHTDCKIQGAGETAHITQAIITLIRKPAIDRQLNSAEREQRLLATLLHETGHALGLNHSVYPGDLMHHRNWRRATLAEGDIGALRRLYEAPPKVRG